jgi:hypothetical protein
MSFTQGTYRFDIFHDDGARLYIDSEIVFEDWCDNCRQTDTITRTLTTGIHNLKLEMWENIGWAGAQLNWGLDEIFGAIEGTVDLQGRADESAAEVCVEQVGTEVDCTTTDSGGNFTFSLIDGNYDVIVEMGRYLDAEKTGQVVVAGNTTSLCQVKLLGGDANDDDVINILDLSFMGYRFGQSVGDPDWDDRADVNNDGTINILDITGAGSNFNKTSPVPWTCP